MRIDSKTIQQKLDRLDEAFLFAQSIDIRRTSDNETDSVRNSRSPTSTGWNQLDRWLRAVDALRRAA